MTGQDDGDTDGDIAYTIVTAAAVSDDGDYDGVNPADVSVTNRDNETRTVTVSSITDAAGSVTFQRKNAPSGSYTTTVTAVQAPPWTWDGVTPSNSFTKP